tara:strand:- start:476 stop:652 length:177 start_codon:yes stop_codon:yes gene_type:complete
LKPTRGFKNLAGIDPSKKKPPARFRHFVGLSEKYNYETSITKSSIPKDNDYVDATCDQ